MTRDARLALAEDGGQVLHGQIGAGEEGEDAQAGGFAGGAQSPHQRVETDHAVDNHLGWTFGYHALPRILCVRYTDIFIRRTRSNHGASIRRMRVLFHGETTETKPSKSPFARWVNDPAEPEELPADWQPPPLTTSDPDEPPPF